MGFVEAAHKVEVRADAAGDVDEEGKFSLYTLTVGSKNI